MKCAIKLSIDLAIDKCFNYIFGRKNKILFKFKIRERGYTNLFLERNRVYSFLCIFEDISTKNHILKRPKNGLDRAQ